MLPKMLPSHLLFTRDSKTAANVCVVYIGSNLPDARAELLEKRARFHNEILSAAGLT